jgi:FAD/FMN-containing dehydrogenase
MRVANPQQHPESVGAHATVPAATLDWGRFEASLTGDLLVPGSAGYEATRRPAQPQPTDHRPAAIVVAANAADVAAAIRFGREHGVRTVPRSGGHCFAGRSSTSGMIVDVSSMNQIAVADRQVTVGAGARLGKIYDALEPDGLTVPAGTWPTVGIAGNTLGGGSGLMGRASGLTCDRLVAAEVVLADGQVVWCDEDREPGLFWALRGAGGGQLGIVTSLVLDAVPAPAETVSFHLTWPYEHAAAAMASWQAWAPDAPDELDVSLRLVAPADPRRIPEINVFGMMLNANAANTARLLGELIEVVGTEPTWVLQEQRPYVSAVRRLTGLGTDHRPGSRPAQIMLIRSEFFRQPFPVATAAALAEQFAAHRTPGYVRELNFTAWGGAYNRVSVDATAFAHRKETFLLEHTSYLDPVDPVPAHELAWRDASWRTVHPWGTGGVYPNFPDPDLDDGETAYHGSNLTRLRQVKRRYDPDNWFRFHQSLTPAGENSVPHRRRGALSDRSTKESP